MSTMNIFDLTDTWNAGGTTFTAIKMNATDTASAAGSLLIDLQVGGVSQFSVTKAGAVTAVGVAIPTISSTSTLTNKTLTAPTINGASLSGTLAGTPTFNALITFDAGVKIGTAGSTYAAGSLGYTDTNHGFLYRPPRAGALYAHAFQSFAGSTIVGITEAGVFSVIDAVTAFVGTAIPAGGTTGAGLKVSSTANFGVFFGSGAPTLSAAKGSLYMRSDGSGVNDRMYVNTDGSTSWTAVVTVG